MLIGTCPNGPDVGRQRKIKHCTSQPIGLSFYSEKAISQKDMAVADQEGKTARSLLSPYPFHPQQVIII